MTTGAPGHVFSTTAIASIQGAMFVADRTSKWFEVVV
jgi:hypothetical protein